MLGSCKLRSILNLSRKIPNTIHIAPKLLISRHLNNVCGCFRYYPGLNLPKRLFVIDLNSELDVINVTKSERDRRSIADLENEICDKLANFKKFYEDASYQDALKEAEAVLPLMREAYGEEHPVTASGYNNQGLAYRSLYNFDQAEIAYNKALSIYESLCGPNNPSTLTTMTNLAQLYKLMAMKEHPDNRFTYLNMAESLASDAYESRLESFGDLDQTIIISRRLLASIYRLLDQPNKCEQFLKLAEESAETMYGKQHIDTATVYNDMAYYYKSIGKYELSESYYLKSIDIRLLFLGEIHTETITARYNLSELYKEWGRTDDSLKLMQIVVDQIRSNYMTQEEAEEFIKDVVEHSSELC